MGALVVYSVTDRDSFSAVGKWISKIQENAGPTCQIVLVANKTDTPTKEWLVT